MSNETKMDGVLEALAQQTVETAVELRRVEIFGLHREALERLAQRAMTHRGVHPKDLVMVCIDVNDHVWRPLVDHLMPDNNGAWDALRADGAHPYARGSTVGRGIQDVLDIAPRTSSAAKALTEVAPSTVCIPVVVFSEGGASVFTVDPAKAVSGTST